MQEEAPSSCQMHVNGGNGGESVSVSDLQRRLEDALKLADERLEQILRCRADLDNTIKRAAREKEEQSRYASERLIKRMLCILDSLDQAARHDEGSRILYQQLMDVLKGEGLVPIEAVGCKFDPYLHEAMMQVVCEDMQAGYIAEEFQRGYTLNSKVIRTSKVAVVKDSQDES